MKNFCKIAIITVMSVLVMCGMAFAADKKIVSNVIVTDIEVPYSEENALDTSAKVPSGAHYRVTDVAWKVPENSSTGCYEVTVTLVPDYNYIFSEETTGTVNGNSIISKKFINEEKISITYAFETEKNSVSNATAVLMHRISTYCNENKGTISPYVIRVAHGKNQVVTITPKEGYEIEDVVVDGESVGAVSQYMFKDVKENHTLRAYFKEVEQEEVKEATQDIKPMLETLIGIIKVLKIGN